MTRDSRLTTTIWLARHGEVHNPSNVLYGRLPRIRLTAEGLRQSEALAACLASRPLAAIYSSPMLRARRTAEIIRKAHPDLRKVRIDADLNEVGTGWQGEPIATLERINWDFYTHPRTANDESIQTIHARMMRWLHRMLRRHAGAEVVGVSHGDPILILTGSLRGVSLQHDKIFPRPYIPTGVLYEMRFASNGNCQDVHLVVPREQAAA